MTKPRIGLLLGDPCGVGPAVAAGAALDLPEAPAGAPLRNAPGPVLHHIEFAGREGCPPGRVSAQAGAQVLDLLRLAAAVDAD